MSVDEDVDSLANAASDAMARGAMDDALLGFERAHDLALVQGKR